MESNAYQIVSESVDDWYISSEMLDDSINEILNRVTVDRSYDIPYLAGYSEDGKRVYIDKDVPKSFNYKGIDCYVDRYLILHETIEKALIEQLNLSYQHAHQIALRSEKSAVLADGISWKVYDAFMQKYIKEIGSKRLSKVPKDLDLKPYEDEHDTETIDRMKQVQTDSVLV